MLSISDPYSHIDQSLTYIEESVPGPGANLDDFFSYLDCRCDCNDSNRVCSTKDKCNCVRMVGECYIDGKLKDEIIEKHMGVWECGPFCNCFSFCENSVVRNGPNRNLKIMPAGQKGLGVFAAKPISKGSFICEYAGEVLGIEEAKHRMPNNYKYLLILREHFTNNVTETYVDATSIGNIGRYVNHSCSPNCAIVPVRAGHRSPKVAIFATKDINLEEEVTYAYCNSSIDPSGNPCHCGSSECIQFLPRDDFVLL